MASLPRATRHPLWLYGAALASLLGSGTLLALGRRAEGVSAEVGGGPAALGLLSLVLLLAVGGLTLAGMATRELLVQRRQSHV